MINLEDFLKGEVAYIIDKETEDTFLSELESKCDIKWLSGDKPTDYKSYWIWYDESKNVVIGVVNKLGVIGLGHGYEEMFENYRVEVFKC